MEPIVFHYTIDIGMPQRQEMEVAMYDMIIIGAGPAGLGAAVYAIRAAMKILVIEQSPLSGGQIINTDSIDNYLGLPGIGGYEIGAKFREHADQLGVPFKEAKVTKLELTGDVKKVWLGEEVLETRTVLLATGAVHALLGVPGETEYAGRGVSYCATCDGAFFRGQEVAVVGGGNVALEDAMYLSRFCPKVYLIHRRDEFRADGAIREEVLANDKIVPVMNTVVEEILGDGQLLTGLRLKDVADQSEKTLDVVGAFLAVGIVPVNELIRGQIELDPKGYVVAGEDCVTSVPGVYVAGDLRSKKLRQVITAVSDGAQAVAAAGEYLRTLR